MKNYWHIVALSTTMSVLMMFMHSIVVLFFFLMWLFYLFIFKRIPLSILIVSLLSFFYFLFYLPSPQALYSQTVTSDDEPNDYTGKMLTPVSQTDKKIEFLVEIEPTGDKLVVVYFMNDNKLNELSIDHLKYGAMCTLRGQRTIPSGARNPYQFDYQQYLLEKGVSQQLVLQSLGDITCAGGSQMNQIYVMRDYLLDVATAKLMPDTAAWLKALVLGDDSFIPDDIKKIFQRWSLTHILAISGLHIGIIVGLLYFLLIQTSAMTKEKAQWLMVCFLPVYALLAGGEPSVWRASLMVMFVIALSKMNLKYSYTDMISIVFILLLALNKFIIFHIGFQLSFAVTFGLILSSRWLATSSSKFMQLLQISFVSQMAILPLQLHYFSTFQPLSIFLNVIVVPYFSIFVIPCMFLLLIFIQFPLFFVTFFEHVFLRIHRIFLFLLEKVDAYLHYPFVIGEFPLYFTVIYYVIFVLLMIALESGRIKIAMQQGILLVLFIVFLAVRPYFSPVGTVTMLDIGQGDAFVVELPHRKGVFLIDAGAALTFPGMEATAKQYEQVLKPFLFHKGISKIDAIFVSHEHLDHYGSIPFLLEEITVDEVIISDKYVIEQQIEQDWLASGAVVTRTDFDEVLMRKGQVFRVVSPNVDMNDANENSLVLYTVLGGYNWLFTGDIYKAGEMSMVKNYATLPVDVLKVGHHGSNTSTDERFLKHISPKYALIPVGVNNMYGHPTSEVIDTLTNQGIEIFRSDEDGAVQFHYVGEQGFFQRFLEE